MLRIYKVPEHLEDSFVSILEAVERCQKTFDVQYTAFLDPEVLVFARPYLNQSPCRFEAFGGYADAEYQVLALGPETEESTFDFPMVAMEIAYQPQFGHLEHKDVLGALMSLGIERKVIGDILVSPETIHFFALAHLERYLMDNLEKVKRQGVQLRTIPFEAVQVPKVQRDEVSISVSSLRLDAVIAHAFHMSRTQAVAAIKAGYVKVNYAIVERTDFPVANEQLISVRRYGRFWVGEVTGVSKKGKLRLKGWITLVKS